MISKASISFIQSLKQKKYRQKYDKYILEGEKIIMEGLNEGLISFDSIYCLTEKAPFLEHINIKYNIIDHKTMGKLSNLRTPPGILAVANIPERSIPADQNLTGLILCLDNIKDPGNMGTIIRTADWFGVRTVIASPESVDFYNPNFVQASMGSNTRVQLSNMDLTSLKTELPIYATTLSGKSLQEFKRPENMILVIGSESHGVSQKVLALSKESISIEKDANSLAESLNAGIATAIFLSHLSTK